MSSTRNKFQPSGASSTHQEQVQNIRNKFKTSGTNGITLHPSDNGQADAVNFLVDIEGIDIGHATDIVKY